MFLCKFKNPFTFIIFTVILLSFSACNKATKGEPTPSLNNQIPRSVSSSEMLEPNNGSIEIEQRDKVEQSAETNITKPSNSVKPTSSTSSANPAKSDNPPKPSEKVPFGKLVVTGFPNGKIHKVEDLKIGWYAPGSSAYHYTVHTSAINSPSLIGAPGSNEVAGMIDNKITAVSRSGDLQPSLGILPANQLLEGHLCRFRSSLLPKIMLL